MDGSVSTSMPSHSGNAIPNVQGVQGVQASVSNSSAVNRRNQQVARRSARNRDKVVIAAERCLTRVLDVMCCVEFRAVIEIVHQDNISNNSVVENIVLSEEQLHECLLAHFTGDMRAYVKNVMKW